MLATDRMGSFIRARVIQTKEIEHFLASDGKVKIVPKNGAVFLELFPQKNGISPSVSVENSKSGTIYSISIDIDLKFSSGINFISFNRCIVILTKPNGDEIVFGTPLFPLIAMRKPILSNSPAGKEGENVRFEGKQIVYPYILTI
jgi:hypothetical protein